MMEPLIYPKPVISNQEEQPKNYFRTLSQQSQKSQKPAPNDE